jgi:cytochrome c oxidase assembly protein subunit 11
MNLRGENLKMVGKLAVVTAGMFCFGYALVPIYRAICEITGINILSISETQIPGNAKAGKAAEVLRNSQVDTTRTITVEFDANSRGPWEFKPEKRSMQVHPGELSTATHPVRQPTISTSSNVSASTSTRSSPVRKKLGPWPL